MQQYKQHKSREHNAIYTYMDTKGRMCRHLYSTNKTKNASKYSVCIWYYMKASRRYQN